MCRGAPNGVRGPLVARERVGARVAVSASGLPAHVHPLVLLVQVRLAVLAQVVLAAEPLGAHVARVRLVAAVDAQVARQLLVAREGPLAGLALVRLVACKQEGKRFCRGWPRFAVPRARSERAHNCRKYTDSAQPALQARTHSDLGSSTSMEPAIASLLRWHAPLLFPSIRALPFEGKNAYTLSFHAIARGAGFTMAELEGQMDARRNQPFSDFDPEYRAFALKTKKSVAHSTYFWL